MGAVSLPNTFSALSGNVSASLLDANYSVIVNFINSWFPTPTTMVAPGQVTINALGSGSELIVNHANGSGFAIDIRGNNTYGAQIRQAVSGAREWFTGPNAAGTWEIFDNTDSKSYFTIDSTGQAKAYEPSFSVNATAKVATYDSGSYNAAGVGFSAGTPTYPVSWSRSGNMVTLRIPIQSPGTSNSTAFSLAGTNMPASIKPAVRSEPISVAAATDNSIVNYSGNSVVVETNGSISCMHNAAYVAGGAGWTAANNKGIGDGASGGICFTYPLL